MQERRSRREYSDRLTYPTLIEVTKKQAWRLGIQALGLFFPTRCAGCLRVDELLCTTCRSAFVPADQSNCVRCGRLLQANNSQCASCRANDEPETAPEFASYSVFRYEGRLREAVHQLKYARRPAVAGPLAHEMFRALHHHWPQAKNWRVDVIVPVPLHPQRKAERGYNQARLLAEPLAGAWRLPLENDALIRVRNTPSQVGLDVRQRSENMQGAFVVSRSMVGLNVLLVDDVQTTGATLRACASALWGAGATTVRALTLARAV